METTSTTPLIRRRGTAGEATVAQTLGNIVVSIVGTGVLGLPYAFRVAGWLAGSLGVAGAGACTYFCMLLLIQCRDRFEEHNDEEIDDATHIQSYGDLGAKAFGTRGRYLTEFLVLISQAGGAVAYLVFIGQNLSSLFANTNHSKISPSIFIFLLLLPLELSLSFIRSLSSIAPFSVFADTCNVLAMAIVIKDDFQLFDRFPQERSAFNGTWGLPYAGGVAVFCFEGFSMTLSLQASMADKKKFRWVLLLSLISITLIYVSFGIFGYLAYGDETKDIITLNLPNNLSAIATKMLPNYSTRSQRGKFTRAGLQLDEKETTIRNRTAIAGRHRERLRNRQAIAGRDRMRLRNRQAREPSRATARGSADSQCRRGISVFW